MNVSFNLTERIVSGCRNRKDRLVPADHANHISVPVDCDTGIMADADGFKDFLILPELLLAWNLLSCLRNCHLLL